MMVFTTAAGVMLHFVNAHGVGECNRPGERNVHGIECLRVALRLCDHGYSGLFMRDVLDTFAMHDKFGRTLLLPVAYQKIIFVSSSFRTAPTHVVDVLDAIDYVDRLKVS